MNTVFNLRLPMELKKKVEIEAGKNHTSINQYLLYIISKSMSYNDAMKHISRTFKNSTSVNWKEAFEEIPDIEPFEEDR